MRRSISPQTGETNDEDWPSLSPQRPVQAQPADNLNKVKPSIGESVIEGMRHLRIAEDNKAVDDAAMIAEVTTKSID